MTEHTEQTPSQPGAFPARIQLDDFVEAVTRGVTRALAAQDEVGGYALRRVDARTLPPMTIGLIFPGGGFPLPDVGETRSIRR